MRILATVPSSIASNSIVALSVSISASTVPEVTVSPSFTSHLASVPSSMVGDKAGISVRSASVCHLGGKSVIASAAKQSSGAGRGSLDRFVAALLAMTKWAVHQ
jgi:hypothetical protein